MPPVLAQAMHLPPPPRWGYESLGVIDRHQCPDRALRAAEKGQKYMMSPRSVAWVVEMGREAFAQR